MIKGISKKTVRTSAREEISAIRLSPIFGIKSEIVCL